MRIRRTRISQWITLNLAVLGCTALLCGCGGGGSSSSPAPHPTSRPTSSPTPTVSPTASPTVSPTVTPTPSVTGIPLGTLDKKTSVAVVLANFGGDDATVSLKNRAPINNLSTVSELESPESPAPPLSLSSEPHGCLSMDLSADFAQSHPHFSNSASTGVTVTRNTKYLDLAAGETIQMLINDGQGNFRNRTMRKLCANEDLSDILVFAEVLEDGTTPISIEQAQQINECFAVSNPYDPTGTPIRQRINDNFGKEWLNGGGIDSTSKLIIAIVSSKTMPSLYGYSYTGDEFPKSEVASSNEGEIVYLNANTGKANGFVSMLKTLAHEYQHVCCYNQHRIRDGRFDGNIETTFNNEGQSALGEELVGFGLTGKLSESGDCGSFLKWERFQNYLNSPQLYDLCEWDLYDRGNVNGTYGKVGLFWHYLYDRFGSAKIKKIATSTSVGLDNVTRNTGVSYDQLCLEFATACTGIEDLPHGYKTLMLNEKYRTIDINNNVSIVNLSQLSGDHYTVSKLAQKQTVTLPENSVAVVRINGDGKELTLDCGKLPAGVKGQVIVAKNGKYKKAYNLK